MTRCREQSHSACVCLALSAAAPLHFLHGFAGRAEAWSSFSQLELVFTFSGQQSSVASKNQRFCLGGGQMSPWRYFWGGVVFVGVVGVL